MHIVRHRASTGEIKLALLQDGRPVGQLDSSLRLADLLRLTTGELRSALASAAPFAGTLGDLLAPIDGQTEVWAAGVTYKRSEEARVEESATPDIYSRVYRAKRPELFFKATPRRVSGPESPVAVRADSTWDVPEPEVAIVVN